MAMRKIMFSKNIIVMGKMQLSEYKITLTLPCGHISAYTHFPGHHSQIQLWNVWPGCHSIISWQNTLSAHGDNKISNFEIWNHMHADVWKLTYTTQHMHKKTGESISNILGSKQTKGVWILFVLFLYFMLHILSNNHILLL